ncbi:MAG: cytochrome c oxidase subunit II [Acidobacteriota bacterium]|nr:cytochrome c oxidase subunit II [Acidobacteriota bacterium]
MRRKLTFLACAAVAASLTAGAATASNGGFTPVTPHSPNAHHTLTAYWVILAFTGAIFVLVEGLLVVFVVKYRGRRSERTREGAQVHGHTRLELIWTVIPVVILCIIGIVVFVELPGIANAPAASDPLRVTVEGHQFYWQFDYPNGARTINDLYVPVGRVVDLKVVSTDVIHSWWIPALGGKIQALPGITNHTWFQADAPGTYEGQCAELCGLYHEAMSARVIVTSAAGWAASLGAAAADLGKAEFTGACATCHGMSGQGGYGPNLANNPLLTQKAGLLSIVQNGRLRMPAVGDTWTKAQLDALAAYVKTNIYKGASSGG